MIRSVVNRRLKSSDNLNQLFIVYILTAIFNNMSHLDLLIVEKTLQCHVNEHSIENGRIFALDLADVRSCCDCQPIRSQDWSTHYI